MMEDYYFIDWERIIKNLKEIGAKSVYIELPEGLKQFIPEIDDKLNGFIKLYSGENIYGSCDTNNLKIKVDAILHFGHAPIPNLKYSKNTFFIELKRKITLKKELIKNIQNLMCKKIGILATIQYIPLLNEIENQLKPLGIEVKIAKGDERLFYPGQVLGCDFSSAERIKDDVECFIVLADGTFHASGVALSTGKNTYAIEPFSGNITKIDAEKILKKRFLQIERAKNAKSFGILVSSKIGQYRMSLAMSILKNVIENGKKGYIVIMNEITPQKLQNLNFDAYINTACPRIALDDSSLYEKPIITPEEMLIVLNLSSFEKYTIDRINFVDSLG